MDHLAQVNSIKDDSVLGVRLAETGLSGRHNLLLDAMLDYEVVGDPREQVCSAGMAAESESQHVTIHNITRDEAFPAMFVLICVEVASPASISTFIVVARMRFPRRCESLVGEEGH